MSVRAEDTGGMQYLESLPRRVVTLYVPLAVFLVVLLFPFYWMAMTSFKPDAELISREANPFWIIHPTLAHFQKLLFHTSYPEWMWNTIVVSVVATFGSLAAIDPVHSARHDRVPGRRLRHALGAHPYLSHVPDSVLHVAADGVLPFDPVRAGGMRAHRWRARCSDRCRLRSSIRSSSSITLRA